ncbi:MAG TPA: hypothetical protein VK184_09370 [Nostocaceae cyanobacterium]|nr:hypothetical protein [Nostocaceae cyanobacterium]
MKFNVKLSNIPGLLATVLVSSTTMISLSIPSTAHAQPQASPKCSLATVKGLYNHQLTGWVGSGVNRVPFASYGTFFADGNGSFKGVDTVVTDGSQAVTHNIYGTYTVDSETCTGVAVSPVTGTYKFFILNNGKRLPSISTTPGTTITGTCERI